MPASPLTTLFYCYEYHGKVDPRLEELSWRNYNYVFLCAPDFPLVQDGTRADETFRQRQHAWYLKTLTERKINYEILTGGLEQRINQVVQKINLG
jgi:HTH-type transcriptional repressor of NAD biosynthesis genes